MTPHRKKSIAVLLAASSVCVPLAAHSAGYEFHSAMPNLVVAPTATPTPTADFSASTLFFGAVEVGATGSEQTLTLRNQGTAPLTLGSLDVVGPFAVTSSSCQELLAAGTSCAITLRFAPNTAGNAQGTLTLESSLGARTVTLTGEGLQAAITASAASLAFGNVTMGDTTHSLAVLFSNTGTAPASIGTPAVTVTGADASEFNAVTTCGSNLAVNGSCTTNVSFTPAKLSNSTANLAFNTNAGLTNIGLTGVGQSLAVTTAGYAGSNGSLTVTPASGLTLATTTNAALYNGASLVASANSVSWANGVLTAQFVPLPAAGSYSLTLKNASTSTTGLATATVPPVPSTLVAASGSSTYFGNVTTNTSQSEVFTFTNASGSALSGVSASITGNAYASITSNTCASSLAPNASCSITVTYAPTVLDTLSATLKVVSSAANSPVSLLLTGAGTAPTDTSFSSVSALIHFDTTPVVDFASGATVTSATPAIYSSPAKFGDAAWFNGGTFWSEPASSKFDITTGPFTVEAWVYPSNLGTFNIATNASASAGWSLFISSGYIGFQTFGTLGGYGYNDDVQSSGASYTANAWHHVAVTWDGTAYRMYLDGNKLTASNIRKGSTTGSNGPTASSGYPLVIGKYTQNPSYPGYFQGSIDEVRVTKGVARYTGSSFPVPTAAFPNQ